MTWAERPFVISQDPFVYFSNFAHACALSADGGTAFVSELGATVGGVSGAGVVHVYGWNGSAWVNDGPPASHPAPTENMMFGGHMATASNGSILAVADANLTFVLVLEWNGSAWVARGSAINDPDGSSNLFGSGLALSEDGTRLMIGAKQYDSPTIVNQGKVHHFEWNGTDWLPQTPIEPPAPHVSCYFGASVAISGDGQVLAVGSDQQNDATWDDNGRVDVFDWNGSAWVFRNAIAAPAGPYQGEGMRFGAAAELDADGTVLLVGAGHYDISSGSGWRHGALFVFDWDGSSWIERTSALTPAAGLPNGYSFGAFGRTGMSRDGSVVMSALREQTFVASGKVWTWDYPITASTPTLSGARADAVNNTTVTPVVTVTT